jgi:hypothetical protein
VNLKGIEPPQVGVGEAGPAGAVATTGRSALMMPAFSNAMALGESPRYSV